MTEDDDKDDEYEPYRRKSCETMELMSLEEGPHFSITSGKLICTDKGTPFNITPKRLIVPNKGTLEVTITKIREYKPQIYWINLESYLFEIVEPKPTASKDSWTQVYGSFDWKDDREIKIRIRLRDKEKSDPNYVPSQDISPEGDLSIGIAKKTRDWYYMFKKSGIIHDMGKYHRSTEQDTVALKVEEENEDIKERRQNFKEKEPRMEKLLKERCDRRNERLDKEIKAKEKIEEEKLKKPNPEPKAESQYRNLDAKLPPELKNPTTVKTSGDQKNQKAIDNKKKGINKKKKKNPCCSIL